MKPVIFALLVALIVTNSVALRCHCGGRRQCLESVETCKGADDVCASIIFTGPVPGYFQSCYPSFECQLLSSSSITQGFCCSKDLCN
ncbi:putative three finger toxin MALT0070C-like isoform 4 [Scophthalmus maximus]|uniref:Putative three finger toxin MALT0070C-like n=1 Tax=Scophthalmus maximus TaxID=52904 RepID=A0A2U9CMH2_SCOMX|nr:putative three finger toxin MALT0070C-like [Scophthalmus maximus]AWP17758.1 putative three finger toxin MALT0070C-like isoform 2 [Scophthalmus maximus]AWP17759.1 putative three finger toxin MALT0070C-like isoform 3 [Scophthalmus maximus]AWP17760.1 putative three finger toxin MALT0070C-like isoform 4 [Scophthalmus maximus]